MDDSRSRGDPTTGPAASLSEEHLRNIGAALWTLAFCAATAVIVFADGLEPVERDLDDNEFLSVRTLPVDDVADAVRRGVPNEATVEGVLLAREEGLL